MQSTTKRRLFFWGGEIHIKKRQPTSLNDSCEEWPERRTNLSRERTRFAIMNAIPKHVHLDSSRFIWTTREGPCSELPPLMYINHGDPLNRWSMHSPVFGLLLFHGSKCKGSSSTSEKLPEALPHPQSHPLPRFHLGPPAEAS